MSSLQEEPYEKDRSPIGYTCVIAADSLDKRCSWDGHLRFDNFDYGVVIGYAAMLISLSMVVSRHQVVPRQSGGRFGRIRKALQVVCS